jgi:uncharacterized protein (DUF169 family)
MTDYRGIEDRLRETFNLRRRPVAVTFRAAPPAGVAKFTGTEPSGCSFWRVAAGGRTFYTVPSDHYNCAVGSHTHRMALPPDRAQELDQTLGFMTGLGYLRMEEVPGIPRLPETPGAVVYAPLGDTPVDPDVTARPADASPGGGPPGGDPGAGAVPGSPDLHGTARRPRLRRHREHGLHRKPCLHGSRRR